MRYNVDRIEEGLAVLIDDKGGQLTMPADAFDFEIKAGMFVERARDGGFVARPEAEAAMRQEAAALLADILNKSTQNKA